nr:non-homologous end-joining DNA ligase [Desulfoscipio gibsoniae]
MRREMVEIHGRVLTLTNLDKPFWPEMGLTKAHLIKYYLDMAPYILPYIYNRPLVMKRYPDGIKGDFFYQKECPSYAPEWVETYPVRHTGKITNYVVCNDTATLIWLANQGCVEIHAWLSRIEDVDYPDLAIFDLDPAEGVSFAEVLKVALLVRDMLVEFALTGFPKTSGSSGLHIFIPLTKRYTFAEITEAMKSMAEIIVRAYPERVTTQRSISKRKGKVYLDYLQNGRGKTMAFIYSLRPLPGAPVSTPLTWAEVEEKNIKPGCFNMENILKRVKAVGDLFNGFMETKNNIDLFVEKRKPLILDANTIDSDPF